MDYLIKVLDNLEFGVYNHLFHSGTSEQPKEEIAQNLGKLYEFVNCYSDLPMPIHLQRLHDFWLPELMKHHQKHDIVFPCRTALRILRYSNREPFSPHRDVTFSAFGIAAANSSQDYKILGKKINWGLQARMLSDKPAFLHHFNTNSMKYYIGLFSTAHNDIELQDNLTIGQWMQQRYYYNRNH
jgi:hypothetical protein